MTGRVTRTAQAERDLIEIGRYIATDNPLAAIRLLDRLDEKSQLVREHPGIGHADSVRRGLRAFVVGNYLILYRETPDGVEILRYLHGRRDRSSSS